MVVTEWSPKTKIGMNLLESQLTGLTSEYLYMSLIDLIYYEYLYMSLIDLIYYLNVNFASCIVTNKLHNINQIINNNLVIVHTKPNLSITLINY